MTLRSPVAKPRRGFTLIELLVVISIVGLLMALLLPALRSARHAANRSLCGVRIRSVGTSFLAYLEDHKQWTFMATAGTNGGLRWVAGVPNPGSSGTNSVTSYFAKQDHTGGATPVTSYMRDLWGPSAARTCPDLSPQVLNWDPAVADERVFFGYAMPLLHAPAAGGQRMMDRRSSHYIRLTPGRAYGSLAGSFTATTTFSHSNYDPTLTVPLLTDWLQNSDTAESSGGSHRTAPHNMSTAYVRGINRIDSLGAWTFFVDGTTEWKEFPESARRLPLSEQPSQDSQIVSFPQEVLGVSHTTRPGVIWTRKGSGGFMYFFPVRRILTY